MMLKNFIVFEGIDGSGTTTQIKKLAERFPKEKVFVSAEPTKNETGLFLRRMLKGELKKPLRFFLQPTGANIFTVKTEFLNKSKMEKSH